MFAFQLSRRRAGRESARRQWARHPLVDSLEGRPLLSALAPIQGQHIGAPPVAPSVSLSFTKIELSVAIQGGHIGSVVGDVSQAGVPK